MLDRDLHERATSLFLQLRGLDAGAQRSRLLEAAADDVRLQREVLSLLACDVATSDGYEDSRLIPPTPNTPPPPAHPTHSIDGMPARIGPYRIIERIGRGGSGLVLLAEQDEPVRRRVAIKLAPHAAISPDHAARFEFERRALERTDHPNIARILDAGRTPEGLPYLVMDYVQGVPISEYCRRHQLSLLDRLGIMLGVADGVQHAHQRGVIHRDLKPANILVTDAGGRGTPRILDFGIAKPIPGGIDQTAAVNTGASPLGTPAYMAPEQTGSQATDIRTDVYALGAILYELVCGHPPIDVRGDFVEGLRRIREDVPPPASRARERGDTAQTGPSPPRSFMADLDCIIAKAIEKDPDRRYETVVALAEDIRRLLRHEPITARPATLGYRAGRYIRRHRLVVAASTLVLLALLGGTAGLIGGLIEANRQRREAINQSEAQGAINMFLTDDLLAAASPDQEGQSVTALDLLHRAARRVDRRFTDRPRIAASIHHTLGHAYMELGAFDEADRHLLHAVALRRNTSGPNAPDTLKSEIAAASLLARRERLQESEAALVALIPRARRILGPNDPILYAALNDLGTVYETLDRGKEAAALLEEALAGRERLLGPDDPLVLVTTSNLAQAYDRQGQTERSLELLLQALRIAEGLDEQPRMTILGLCNNIGATYQDLERDAEAVPYLRRAASMAAEHLGDDHPATLTIQGNLAGLESELGDPERGAELYQRVVEARTRLIGPDAFDTLVSRYGYWNSLRLAKRPAEAAEGYTALLSDITRILGVEHWLAVQTRASLARSLLDSGRAEEALPLAEEAARQFQAMYGPDHQRTARTVALVEEILARLAE